MGAVKCALLGNILVFSFHLKSNSERCSTVAVNSKLSCISYQGGSEVWKIQEGSWVILNCFGSGACFIHLQFACAALYYLIDVHVIREDEHWTHKDIFWVFLDVLWQFACGHSLERVAAYCNIIGGFHAIVAFRYLLK